MKSFASDNNSGVHPEVVQAIADANDGHVIAYGDDPHTEKAVQKIKAIASSIRRYGLLLHVDGARLANAAASLNVSLRQITTDAGVDVLSLGGTKNGSMSGESVIFLKRGLSKNFKYIRKQGMQLASKIRFISAQYSAYLSNGLWLRNARHANAMARQLADEVEKIPRIEITQKVETNGVFAIVPKEHIPTLQEKYFFYVWNEATSEVRWMTSFDTTPDDVMDFVQHITAVVS